MMKLAYPDDQTRQYRQHNAEPVVDLFSIARAEALFGTEHAWGAIADALVINQHGSTIKDDNSRMMDQAEIPSSVTCGQDMTPRMRLQHKLCQTQSRMVPGLAIAVPSNSNTDETYFYND